MNAKQLVAIDALREAFPEEVVQRMVQAAKLDGTYVLAVAGTGWAMGYSRAAMDSQNDIRRTAQQLIELNRGEVMALFSPDDVPPDA